MTKTLRFALAAPLALALAACGESAEDTAGAIEGDAIAAIPAPEGQSWLETASKTDDGGYVIGNPDAPLKLVEFASHTCNACAYFATNGSLELQNDYVETGVVSYEIRPLLRDPLDVTISTLAQCGAPESFHALSDQAWASLEQFSQNLQVNDASYRAAMEAPYEERFLGLAQAAGLIDFFAARGLSADQARTCLSDSENVSQIAETSRAASTEANVSATPTFFLNGRRLEENQWQGLEPILQAAGAR
ncbi:MAG: thioredoxin domain-containing protein [Erythrobacter sp.]|nr:thioredoxin domain-containing protein [Erythrobacter sp.]